MTRIGTPPASVARNEPGSATWSARPAVLPGAREDQRALAAQQLLVGVPAERQGQRVGGGHAAMVLTPTLARCAASAPGSKHARQRASYESSAPTWIVSPLERRGLAVDEPLRHRRRPAAAVAHRLELVDELGDAEQRRHRAERQPAEVLGEPGSDDARAVARRAPSIASTMPSSKNCTSSIPTAS